MFSREMAILSPSFSELCVDDFLWRSRRESMLERLYVMSKSILFALLAVTGSSLGASELLACGGARCASVAACTAPSCAAPACAAPTATAPENAAPTDPHAGMKMSQSNSSRMYQSFSYEPGSSQSMMTSPMPSVAPANRTYRQPLSSSFYDSIRGDKKVRAAGGLH